MQAEFRSCYQYCSPATRAAATMTARSPRKVRTSLDGAERVGITERYMLSSRGRLKGLLCIANSRRKHSTEARAALAP